MKMRLILTVLLLGALVAALALIPLVQPVQAASSTGRPDFATIDSYVQAQLDAVPHPGSGARHRAGRPDRPPERLREGQ